MSALGFKPTISVGERPQTYALDCVATETGFLLLILLLKDQAMRKVHEGNNLECVAPAPGCLHTT